MTHHPSRPRPRLLPQLSTLASAVPESVPRPAAKLAVGAVAVTLVSFFVKSLVNTLLLLALLAGGVYFLAGKQLDKLEKSAAGGDDDDDIFGGPVRESTGNQALDDAQRIMDKYK